MLDPREWCYRGAATKCDVQGGPAGVRLADFGTGPMVGYAALKTNAIHLHEPSLEGFNAAPIQIDVGDAPRDLVVHDIDGDGFQDVVVATGWRGDAAIVVQRGLGDASFLPWSSSSAPEVAWAQIGKLNADDFADVIAINDVYYSSGPLHLAHGTPTGGFAAFETNDLGDDVRFDLADFDGDGVDDLALRILLDANERSTAIAVAITAGGALGPVVTLASSPGAVSLPVTGRFNDDAFADIAWYDSDAGALMIALGLGDGSFATAQPHQPGSWVIGAEDLDGDGRDELIAGTAVIPLSLDGTPEPPVVFTVGEGSHRVVSASAADVNGDGLLDLVLGTGFGQSNGSIHLILSDP